MYWEYLYLIGYLLATSARQLQPTDFLVTIEFENNKECIGAMVDRLNVATSSMCLERYNFAKRLYPRPCKVYGGITEDGVKTFAVWRFCIGYKMNDKNFNAKIFAAEDTSTLADIYIPLIPIDIPFDSELVKPIDVVSPSKIANEQGNVSCRVYGWSSNVPKRTFLYKKRDGDDLTNVEADSIVTDKIFSIKKDGRIDRGPRIGDGHRRRPTKTPSATNGTSQGTGVTPSAANDGTAPSDSDQTGEHEPIRPPSRPRPDATRRPDIQWPDEPHRPGGTQRPDILWPDEPHRPGGTQRPDDPHTPGVTRKPKDPHRRPGTSQRPGATQKPDDSHRRPDDPHTPGVTRKPKDPHRRPGTSQRPGAPQKPDDPHRRLDDPHRRLDDPHSRPDDPHRRPDDPHRRPDDPHRRLDDPHRTESPPRTDAPQRPGGSDGQDSKGSHDGPRKEYPPHSVNPRDSLTMLVSNPAIILSQQACERDYLEFRDESLPQGQFCVVESERIADLGRILVCKDSLVGVIADDLFIRETDSGQSIYAYSSLRSNSKNLKCNCVLIFLLYLTCLFFKYVNFC